MLSPHMLRMMHGCPPAACPQRLPPACRPGSAEHHAALASRRTRCALRGAPRARSTLAPARPALAAGSPPGLTWPATSHSTLCGRPGRGGAAGIPQQLRAALRRAGKALRRGRRSCGRSCADRCWRCAQRARPQRRRRLPRMTGCVAAGAPGTWRCARATRPRCSRACRPAATCTPAAGAPPRHDREGVPCVQAGLLHAKALATRCASSLHLVLPVVDRRAASGRSTERQMLQNPALPLAVLHAGAESEHWPLCLHHR